MYSWHTIRPSFDSQFSKYMKDQIIKIQALTLIIFLLTIYNSILAQNQKLADSISSWQISISKTDEKFTSISYLDDKNIWCSSANSGNFSLGTLYKSNNGGVSWNEIFKTDSTSFPSIHFISESIGFATTYGNKGLLLKTTNGGTSWLTHKNNVPSRMYFKKNTGVLYGNKILISSDYGESWGPISSGTFPLSFYCNDVYFIDENNGWLCCNDYGYNNYIFKTTDGGNNWLKIYQKYGLENITNIIGFVDSEVLYFTEKISSHGISASKISKSTDGGLTWEQLAQTGGEAIFFTSPETGWITEKRNNLTYGTISKTTDGGSSWNIEYQDENISFVEMNFYNNKIGWAAGYGSFMMYVDPSITGDIPSGTVDDYYLYQNYPNPFNGTTLISYQIPKTEFISLKIYDTIGNELVTLVNKDQSAGDYKITFSSLHLSSGIYIYKLQAGNFIESKKLILLK